MKQSLSLKLGQSLTMTPQLQQAIRLLQLSSLDLQQEIQENLDSNPMLELDEDDESDEGSASADEAAEAEGAAAATDEHNPTDDDFTTLTGASDGPATQASADEDGDALESVDLQTEESIPEELPVDTSWDDIYQSVAAPSGSAGDDSNWDFEERNPTTESLQDHLLWQLNLTTMSDLDRLIATTIIDAIDTDGMLTLTPEDITQSLNEAAAETTDTEPLIEFDEVIAVLKRIQQFDPTGVAARDLAECLQLQLSQMTQDTLWREQALDLVANHLEVLAARDFTTLKRKTRLTEAELTSVVDLIQSLNPRPGSTIAQGEPEYIVPDVMVQKKNGRWMVELNGEATPRLRINSTYADLVKRADKTADNTFLKDNLQEAKWFLKSLRSRNETLLKVATRIVEHQRGFLEYGEEAMKPLVLADIAEAVEMHESTISRVTSRKYMDTPRGIFELKYFFSSHVSTNTGGEVSSTAIRALIRKLTAEENARKPLSDNKIAAILAKQNIKVARRTVAKYRESLAIPPSNERKRLI
ncbi:MAG: RNA polymerase factor sigma-54 [Gammaproteobacteria bacterium]|nr:RNA polymerase factor sigma-54 [Gammaproteobacteria bacterium]